MNGTDATLVLNLIDGFRRSQTLFAAIQLGIFDGLRPDGPDVQRLLDACASLGLLAKSDSGYANTEIADTYLRSESPTSLAGYVRFASAGLYLKWANLAKAVGGEAARKSNDLGSLETKPLLRHLFITMKRRRQQAPELLQVGDEPVILFVAACFIRHAQYCGWMNRRDDLVRPSVRKKLSSFFG